MSRLSLNVRVAVAVGLAMAAGIAVAGLLVIQLQITSRDYDAILGEREVLHQDQARVVQLTFKKQVQEWKNLLLPRGTPEDFTRYANSFRAEARAARTGADALLAEVMDAPARSILGSFIDAHGKMGTKYGEAIAARQRNGHDVAAADALVKGQDRAPTDLLDELAARLHNLLVRAGERDQVDEVHTATTQQVRTYQQVTQATAQMESVTQSTAASAEESAAASEELSAQAAGVMAAVHALGRLIGATTTRGAGSFAGGSRDERPDESKTVAAA